MQIPFKAIKTSPKVIILKINVLKKKKSAPFLLALQT